MQTINKVSSKQIIARTCLVLLIACAFSACGQKGPLEIEQPRGPQTEETAETR